MTREEAIEELKRDIHNAKVTHHLSEHYEMAIKALSAEPCEDCQRIYKPNPYYDCISRQNAIDAMWEELDEDTAYEVRDILEAQPSVMPEQEPCEDCISRAEAIENIKHAQVNFSIESDIDFTKHKREVQEIVDGILNAQIKVLEKLPPVNPQEPKTGYWIAQDIYNCHTDFKCSECGYIHSFMHLYGEPTADYTYCPNCGCRMESEG